MNLQNYKTCIDTIDVNALNKLKYIVDEHTNIIILGNGGSNAISCHIAQDYTKALGKKALCFGDSSRLSCYANDYGWDHAYTKFIEHFAEKDTLIILLSSSGNSQNILNAADYCKSKFKMITLSGFDNDNKLKTQYSAQSELHFYVNSTDYGIVESVHELILHSIL
jgi:D-sedoheptulose 7-phosphate isomerase